MTIKFSSLFQGISTLSAPLNYCARTRSLRKVRARARALQTAHDAFALSNFRVYVEQGTAPPCLSASARVPCVNIFRVYVHDGRISARARVPSSQILSVRDEEAQWAQLPQFKH